TSNQPGSGSLRPRPLRLGILSGSWRHAVHGTGCQRHRSRDRDSRARRRHVSHPRYEGAPRVPRRVQASPAVATLKRRASLPKEEAQELSEYVEQLRPQDLGKGRSGPGARGRPSLTVGSPTHSPSIHVRLPESLYRRLTRRAGSRGTTVSEV